MEYKDLLKKKSLNIRLQFYSVPPIDSVPLDVVENLAVDRLKVLRCIDNIAQDYIRGSKDYDDHFYSRVSKCSDLGKSFVCNSGTDSSKIMAVDIKRDLLSHFILQLAYCRTEELSKWFIVQEMELFRYRFNLERLNNPNFITKFMSDHDIVANVASIAERKMVLKHMNGELENVQIFKVPVVRITDLIRMKKVYVLKGMGYLIDSDIYSLVASYFRANLSHSLSFLRLSMSQIDEDSRLMPILSTLNKRYLGKDYSSQGNGDKITADQIESLSKISFPPCMQKVHTALKRDHHLKHWGRMQYGLFLKGIGLPLEESLKFWKSNFEEKIDSNTFAKKYAYSIRHNYGQEGKRANYAPYSCQKIITTNPPQAGDCHGCPFQHSNLDLMAQNLRNTTKATSEQLNLIISKAKEKHYQISCRNYFKLVHDLPDDFQVTINHPNEYFEESQKLVKKL